MELARFLEANEKRHNENNATLRNQKESVSNIETQVGKLSKVVQECLIASNFDPKRQPHMMAKSTDEENIFDPMIILEATIEQPDRQPKKLDEKKEIGLSLVLQNFTCYALSSANSLSATGKIESFGESSQKVY